MKMPNPDDPIPPTFIQHAADILGDTSHGLTGTNIMSQTAAYATEYDIELPYHTFPRNGVNKRTVLFKNLMAFTPPQQYRIIKELCEHPSLSPSGADARTTLKVRLLTRYGYLDTASDPASLNAPLIEETKHWLANYPDALKLYDSALHKLRGGVFHRNLLDDLRLSLEKLLRVVLENQKSLENQIPLLGAFIRDRGGSKELANMFVKLVDYYASYQNTYVKHEDAVIEDEIEFVFEITSSFMKHVVRLKAPR